MTSEIVIARYEEDLDWVANIPPEFDVHIYNKGGDVPSAAARKRADQLTQLANSGRESDTILRHVLNKSEFTDGYTIFLQGDPFEHSPDIIELLQSSAQWRDLQPLSWRYVGRNNLPPPNILARDQSDFIEGARVRSELFSLMTWTPIQFFDPGADYLSKQYRSVHELPDGINIAAHFLRRCEWPNLAEQAERHLLGRFPYGALFAVRQSMLPRVPPRSLELALQAANSHLLYGYVLERLWLHMFGEPFTLPVSDPALYVEDLASLPARFAPPEIVPTTKEQPRRRVIPRIRRRLASWVQG